MHCQWECKGTRALFVLSRGRSRKIRKGTWTLTQPETNYIQRHFPGVSTVLKSLSTSVAKCMHAHRHKMYTHAHTAHLRRQLCLLRGNSSLGLWPPTPWKYLLQHSSLFPPFLSPGKRRPFPASGTQLSPPPTLPWPHCFPLWLALSHHRLNLLRSFSSQNNRSSSSFPTLQFLFHLPFLLTKKFLKELWMLMLLPASPPANSSFLSSHLPSPQCTLVNGLAKFLYHLYVPKSSSPHCGTCDCWLLPPLVLSLPSATPQFPGFSPTSLAAPSQCSLQAPFPLLFLTFLVAVTWATFSCPSTPPPYCRSSLCLESSFLPSLLSKLSILQSRF